MALQTTYSNEQRERRPMSKGQTTPYLDMLRARIPSVRIEIIEDTGHPTSGMRSRRRMRYATVSLPRCSGGRPDPRRTNWLTTWRIRNL